MIQLPLEVVPIETPTGANLILGQAHFIKTAEDLYETIVNSVPSAKFGVAFSEASGPRLIRSEGNDAGLQRAAEQELLKLSCGHAFLVFLRESFPVNLLRDIRACVEVVGIFCATANPVSAVVVRLGDASAILGVMDGQNPLGVENEDETRARREFIRKIGYKR